MICSEQGQPIQMLLTAGQVSDYKGAAALLSGLPQAKELLADRGYDAGWFRLALIQRGITPCIPPKRNRKFQHSYNQASCKKRRLIENLFSRLKDWRRIATRYDRCAHTFCSAICITAALIFYLN